jgi:multisubunit Na+/H+ antiporter MnhB subunit
MRMAETSSRITMVALVLTLLLFVSLVYVVLNEPFPSAPLRREEMIPTQPSGGVGRAMSGFLWDFRGLDLFFQTLLLFATAICCLAMLKEEM